MGSRLVSMDKGFNHSHGFLGSLLTTVGGQNKSDSRWNTPATADNISFRNDWRNPMQCEQRKEGIKKVTWDEMVQVRTIEPCPGRGGENGTTLSASGVGGTHGMSHNQLTCITQ